MTASWAEGSGTLTGAASFPFKTSLDIAGGLACPVAWLWAAPFSLEGSLGTGRSLIGSEAFSLAGSFSFPTELTWSTPLEGSTA